MQAFSYLKSSSRGLKKKNHCYSIKYIYFRNILFIYKNTYIYLYVYVCMCIYFFSFILLVSQSQEERADQL